MNPASSNHRPPSPLSQQSSSPFTSKKRKIDRACDACRRRKTKCDGPKMPDNVCTNCVQTRKPCTYLEASKPRGPPKAYVVGLEDKLEKMELILKQLRPDADFSDELGPPVVSGSWKSQQSNTAVNTLQEPSQVPVTSSITRSNSPSSRVPSFPDNDIRSRLKSPLPPYVGPTPLGRTTHLKFKHSKRDLTNPTVDKLFGSHRDDAGDDSSSTDSFSSDSEEIVHGYYSGPRKLTLHGANMVYDEDNHVRFHGKSSAIGLVESTRKFKEMHLQDSVDSGDRSQTETPPSRSGDELRSSNNSTRRPEFWGTPKWELVWEGLHVDSPELVPSILVAFPPPDLAQSLIHLYFLHINIQMPLLHRPTFDRQWREKLHHQNIWFCCLCLSIFGVASRWSKDPRVLAPNPRGETGEPDWSLAGWTYWGVAMGIHRVRRSLLYPATLFEVQTFTLLSMFLRATSTHPAAWILVAVGLRKAQDVGAHRKKIYNNKPTVDDELWKRAFWCLVVLDRLGGVGLGRACGVGEEDFDIDLPLEVDDEYWETGDSVVDFQQPPGVPARISAFNLYIRLTQIMAFTMNTVYAINKSKVISKQLDWPEVIGQLTMAMADWVDSIPEHLKWSSQMQNAVFANQAATLYTTYYITEMLIYRPFIPSVASRAANQDHTERVPSSPPFPFPALDICTNAARSCARIIEVHMRRGLSDIPNWIHVAYIAAGMLAVSFWDIKLREKLEMGEVSEDIKPPVAQTVETLLADISIFIDALEWAEPRWPIVTPFLEKIRDSLPDLTDRISEQGRRPFVAPEMAPASHFDQNTHPEHWSSIAHSHPTSDPPLRLVPQHLVSTHPPRSSSPATSTQGFYHRHSVHDNPNPYTSRLRTSQSSLPSNDSSWLSPPELTQRHSNGDSVSPISISMTERSLPYLSSAIRQTDSSRMQFQDDDSQCHECLEDLRRQPGILNGGVVKYDSIDIHHNDGLSGHLPLTSIPIHSHSGYEERRSRKVEWADHKGHPPASYGTERPNGRAYSAHNYPVRRMYIDQDRSQGPDQMRF